MTRKIILCVTVCAAIQACTAFDPPHPSPVATTPTLAAVTMGAPPPVAAAPAPRPAAMVSPPAAPAPVGKGEVYPLWYATNRKPIQSEDGITGYSFNTDDQTVHYGKLFVDIPEDFLEKHRDQGWLKKLFFKSAEATLKVRPPIALSARDFFSDLKDELEPLSSRERVALIYLHGFQTTFIEAAQRAASIGYQLKIPVTTFFSWPSKGGVLSYEGDKRSAEVSEDQIARYLVNFVQNSGATKVHVVAHSMGSYALLRSMFRPVMQSAIHNGIRFGQVILAAPDVDTALFLRDASQYTKVAERVTLYASKKDYALLASFKLAGHGRAGLMPPATVAPGIDTIDVSTVNLTLLGHSYVADEIATLEDMHKLISHNEPPYKRTRLHKAQEGNYWLLR